MYVIKTTRINQENNSVCKESKIRFCLNNGTGYGDTFLLRKMRVILSKLELLVTKDKLNAYKKLERERERERERILPFVVKLAEIE